MRLQNLSMPKSNSSVPTLEGLLTRNSSSSVFQNYMPIPTKFLLTRQSEVFLGIFPPSRAIIGRVTDDFPPCEAALHEGSADFPLCQIIIGWITDDFPLCETTLCRGFAFFPPCEIIIGWITDDFQLCETTLCRGLAFFPPCETALCRGFPFFPPCETFVGWVMKEFPYRKLVRDGYEVHCLPAIRLETVTDSVLAVAIGLEMLTEEIATLTK